MNNQRRFRLLIAVIALVLGPTLVLAHNGIEHIMGTITAVTDGSITVDTVKHTSVTVMIDPSTKYSYNDAQASRKDLKVGERVVINAKENAEKKLVGVSVKWGAKSSMTTTDHADHKK